MPPKLWWQPANLHGVKTHKTTICQYNVYVDVSLTINMVYKDHMYTRTWVLDLRTFAAYNFCPSVI